MPRVFQECKGSVRLSLESNDDDNNNNNKNNKHKYSSNFQIFFFIGLEKFPLELYELKLV